MIGCTVQRIPARTSSSDTHPFPKTSAAFHVQAFHIFHRGCLIIPAFHYWKILEMYTLDQTSWTTEQRIAGRKCVQLAFFKLHSLVSVLPWSVVHDFGATLLNYVSAFLSNCSCNLYDSNAWLYACSPGHALSTYHY